MSHNTTRKKAKTYNPFLGCPPGYHKRAGHERLGQHRRPLCIPTKETATNQVKPGEVRRMTSRLVESAPNASGKCGPGEILRKSYVRKFRGSVRREGYSVHKEKGKTYRIYPKQRDVHVKAACVKDPKAVAGKQKVPIFGEMKRRELLKHGYHYSLPINARRKALETAITEYSPIYVYKKLSAVSVLSKEIKPVASSVFAEDRDWVKKQYNITDSMLA
jgi:hypothetical protein